MTIKRHNPEVIVAKMRQVDDLVRQPVVLCDLQREIILKIYGSPTRRAIVGLARKNGETALVVMPVLA